MVPMTASPYAAARWDELRKLITIAATATRSVQLTNGM